MSRKRPASTPHRKPSPVNRRSFLGTLGVGAAATAALKTLGLPALEGGSALAAPSGASAVEDRREEAYQLRVDAAQLAKDRTHPGHPSNGEEQDYPYVASYSKGLPHDSLGEVDASAYEALLAAVASGDPADFAAIPRGGPRTLTNPQSGLAFDLEGPDCHALAIRPAPRIDGPENSSEMGELYWMALLRDIEFTDFATHRLVAAAARDMSRFSDFRGPKVGGSVTPATLFRGNTPGDLVGPYVSQFLLRDFQYGTLLVSHRQLAGRSGTDYVTTYGEWLDVQNGSPRGPEAFDPVRRYIRTPRDLATYVHYDALYEAYLNACLILLGMGAPLDAGNPYPVGSNQHGFGTFGGPHILSLVTEVASRALKAVWLQKWFVHRRQRPEEFGGRIHNHLTGAASYPIDEEILDSMAVQAVFRRHGSYLLPQAYPEGSPTHPSYGAGHATVAGACVTILKAWFDESFVIPDAVVPNRGGTALVPYTGPDAGLITVGGELNKVAANVANGRNIAGIHWRADYWESVRLGERIAVGILEEQKATYNEPHSFTLTSFDGHTITI